MGIAVTGPSLERRDQRRKKGPETFLKARGLYQGVSVGSSRARISERHLASPAGGWLGSFSAPPTRVVKNVFQDFSLPEVRTQLVY